MGIQAPLSSFSQEVAFRYEKYVKQNSCVLEHVAEMALLLSKRWEITDIKSIINIVSVLDQLGTAEITDLSPRDIWLHRCCNKDEMDMQRQLIYNTPLFNSNNSG